MAVPAKCIWCVCHYDDLKHLLFYLSRPWFQDCLTCLGLSFFNLSQSISLTWQRLAKSKNCLTSSVQSAKAVHLLFTILARYRFSWSCHIRQHKKWTDIYMKQDRSTIVIPSLWVIPDAESRCIFAWTIRLSFKRIKWQKKLTEVEVPWARILIWGFVQLDSSFITWWVGHIRRWNTTSLRMRHHWLVVPPWGSWPWMQVSNHPLRILQIAAQQISSPLAQ